MAKKWFSLFGLYLIKKFWFSVDNSYIDDGNGDNKDDGIDNGGSDSSDGNYVKDYGDNGNNNSYSND